ncbi:MAG: ROK family protein [Nitriliruptorales bacterium]|nr:ROK family protein [Nitriliruptorales bacterium]
MSIAVGVDLGGTNIDMAAVDDDHRVVERARLPTPEGPDAVIEAIVGGVRALKSEASAVGVGAPGPVHQGILVTAPNLVGVTRPVPLAERLSEALTLPVVAENDANAGVIGEWVAGAGRDSNHLMGVWLGTGVGGGLVLEGRLFRGAFGGAGEFGHMCIRQGGALCGCGRRGCIEAYAGRASMERFVETAVASGRHTLLTELRAGKGRHRITSGIWARALEQGDELATAVLDEAVAALGAGIGAAINLLDLDHIVIGGGLAEKLGRDLVERVERATKPFVLVRGDREFVVADLGDDAGVVGAASLARATTGRGGPHPRADDGWAARLG